jgi:putative hemolysin
VSIHILGDIGIVLLFIGTAGIFVAAEIALISLRESQIRQLAGKGKRGDRVVALTKNPNGLELPSLVFYRRPSVLND